jgi:hypothetical protein
MQVETWLNLPDLYSRLPPILSVSNIESGEVGVKAGMLKELLDNYTRFADLL